MGLEIGVRGEMDGCIGHRCQVVGVILTAESRLVVLVDADLRRPRVS